MVAWSGLYDLIHGVPYSTIGTDNVNRRLRRALRGTALKTRAFRKIVRALNGVAPGGTALSTRTRVVAPAGAMQEGGVRAVETVTEINRVTTTADQTAINLEIDGLHTPSPFPVEKSGNSGGGKLGF